MNYAIAVLAGVLLVFLPEAFLILLLGIIIFLAFRSRLQLFSQEKTLISIFLCFIFLIIIHYSNNFVSIILFGVVFFIFNKNYPIEKRNLHTFLFSVTTSLIGLSIYSFFQVTLLQPSSWFPFQATYSQEGIFDVFSAQHPTSEYVTKRFGIQGAAEIEAYFLAKADTDIQINLSLIQFGSNVRYDRPCSLKKQLSVCKVSGFFQDRNEIIAAFGSYLNQEWAKGDSKIKVEKLDLNYLTSPPLLSLFQNIPRAKGLSFNYNAFGSHMMILGLIIFLFFSIQIKTIIKSHFSNSLIFFYFFVFLLLLVNVFISGSRAALFGLLIGFFIIILFVLVKNSLWRLCILVSLLCIASFLSLREINSLRFAPLDLTPNVNVATPRSFDFSNDDSWQGRFAIWRLAVKAWLENPRTFMIGVGDLRPAMQAQFDTRSSAFGLQKDKLTHAHNLWLQTAGESGLFGLLVMLWLWGWAVQKAWKARDAGALAMFAAIFVINSVDYLFFYAPVHLCFWWAVVGFRQTQPQTESSTLSHLGLVNRL